MSGMSILGAAAPQHYDSALQHTQPSAGAPTQTEQPNQPPAPPEEPSPTLVEMMQEAREKAEERRKQLQPKSTTRYGDAPMEAYARLGRARSAAEVNAAAGYARRRLVQFQAALRRDSDNAERIRAAISQLQKVVQRAGKKKRELDREKLIKLRQRKAAQEDQRRESLRLKQELRRRQTMRMIRESGYLRETEIDNRLQDQMAATRMELRAQAQALSAAAGPSVDSAIQQYAVDRKSTRLNSSH